MRFSMILLASLLTFTGCKKETGDDQEAPDGGGGSGSNQGGDATFSVRSSDITLQPGEETTKCFYFHTPNTETVNIHKWSSHMTPGSHHMIMFFSSGGTAKEDGTIDEDCGLGGGTSNVPIWVYASQTEDQTVELPSDDGAGKPLAQTVAPNTAAVFQMHYLNTTDNPQTVHVELNAYALDAAAAFTPTAAYITYHQAISIPPDAVGAMASGTCTAPAGVKFWTMSSHSHKQSVHTQINDGSNIVFQSDDWEHPGSKDWTSPFYTFSTNKITFSCTYNNNNPADPNHTKTITSGQSAQFDEMCMATGYIFPATSYKGCICFSPTQCAGN